jgi:hypothetical protein
LRTQVVEQLAKAEILKIVAQRLEPEKGRELFVHPQDGVLAAGAKHVVAVLDLLEHGLQFAPEPLLHTESQHGVRSVNLNGCVEVEAARNRRNLRLIPTHGRLDYFAALVPRLSTLRAGPSRPTDSSAEFDTESAPRGKGTGGEGRRRRGVENLWQFQILQLGGYIIH